MGKRILLVDQFGEITGGQVVLQALISAAHDGGYSVGILAPMGGALESTIRAAWGDKAELFNLKEARFTAVERGLGDVLRMLAYCWYVLRFLRLVSGYDAVYVNSGRLAIPFFLLLEAHQEAALVLPRPSLSFRHRETGACPHRRQQAHQSLRNGFQLHSR